LERSVAVDKAIAQYIGEINVACGCALILAKHTVDGLVKLRAAILIDTASVYPEILYVVLGGLCYAKSEFRIARFGLAFASAFVNIFEGDLVVICAPGV
jgi:hypothetical protein